MHNQRNMSGHAGLAVAGVLAAAIALTGVVVPAQAQEDYSNYPQRPITLVIPFAPGAGNDILGRQIALRLSDRLGQPVIPENIAGAGGSLGVTQVVKSAPDGYTIGMGTTSTLAINPATNANLPYDPIEDVAPVTLLAETPYVLAVHPTSPFDTVNDLIAFAKENPGVLNYGSAGVGTTNHLAGAIFGTMAGIELQHVPYSGANPAMTDVMANEIEMTFAPILSGMPQVDAGTLKALGVSGAERSPAAPDIAPIAELAGLPDYNVVNWYGIIAPAGTPEPIVKLLSETIVSIMSDEALREQLRTEGASVVANTPEEFSDFLRADLERWHDAATAAGLAVN